MELRPTSMHPAFAGFNEVFSKSPMSVEAIVMEPPVPEPQRIVIPRGVEEKQGTSACSILIGVAVLLMIIWIWRNYISAPQVYPCFTSQGISGKLANASAPLDHSDHFFKLDAALMEKVKGGKLHNLTPCTDDSCKNYKSMPNEAKVKHSEAIHEFMDSHKLVMLLVYAPWCPHCTNVKPVFAEAAAEASIPFAVVNAEMVMADSVFAGEKKVCDLKYFPTIVLIDTTKDRKKITPLAEAPTKTNILKMLEAKHDDMSDLF